MRASQEEEKKGPEYVIVNYEAPQKRTKSVRGRKADVAKGNKTLQKELDDKRFDLQAKHIDRMQEMNTRQKLQMKNACKSLMKVDEYLSSREGGNVEQVAALNDALTDLRDALNMLNT